MLRSYPNNNIKEVWAQIGQKTKSQYDALSTVVDPRQNFRNYREAVVRWFISLFSLLHFFNIKTFFCHRFTYIYKMWYIDKLVDEAHFFLLLLLTICIETTPKATAAYCASITDVLELFHVARRWQSQIHRNQKTNIICIGCTTFFIITTKFNNKEKDHYNNNNNNKGR